MNGFRQMLVGAGLLLALSVPVLAQGTADPAKPGQTGVQGKPAKAGKGNRGPALANMSVEVIDSITTLKDDQKAKITDIQAKLKTDLAAEPDKTKHKALTDSANKEIQAVLTPEQMTAIRETGPMVRLLNQSKAIPTNALASVKLTADQKDKIKPLATETAAKLKAAPKGDKTAQQPILADFKTKVEALLTQEQKDAIARAPRGKGGKKIKKNATSLAKPAPLTH
jgi:hypothetical protein